MLLTSLDGRPLAETRRLLLSLPGYTLRSRPGRTPPEPQPLANYAAAADWFTLEPEAGVGRPSGNLNGGAGPNWMERIEATITLDLAATQLVVFPLDGNGARLDPLAGVERAGAGFRFQAGATPWYELVLGAPPVPRRR